MREARRRFPGVPHVAVFDTAFHATIPEEASTYAVPRAWRDMGIRRYGFHGLSVEWSTERAAAMLGAPPTRLVCATSAAGRRPRPSSTAARWTPPWASARSRGSSWRRAPGPLDPDIPLHLILRRGLDPKAVEGAINEEGGLLALAGTGDMREVEAAAAAGDAGAAGALAVHDHRLAGAVAAMAASLGGLDALVFTGGAGEGSARRGPRRRAGSLPRRRG